MANARSGIARRGALETGRAESGSRSSLCHDDERHRVGGAERIHSRLQLIFAYANRGWAEAYPQFEVFSPAT